jgi:hypothetical protein
MTAFAVLEIRGMEVHHASRLEAEPSSLMICRNQVDGSTRLCKNETNTGKMELHIELIVGQLASTVTNLISQVLGRCFVEI